MADEIVYPPNNTSPLMEDIGTNMMNEEALLANDINPSFPQCEVINIPEIIPPNISMKDRQKAFQQSSSHTDTPYTPISQLMKQTEELAAALDGPLKSNVNEHMNFHHLQSKSNVEDMNMQNPLVNNNINFASQNTQCLVIRGQRIPITSQSQQSSSVINIKHAPNDNSPLVQTCSTYTMHNNSVINASNVLKQTITTKTSSSQHSNKPPMKGQIIKTSDQRLMFVTEVNGKRVGYLIQQPKQPNAHQPSHTPAQNIVNQHFDQEAGDVKDYNKIATSNMDIDNQRSSNSESINFTLDKNKEIVMTHSENISKVNTEPLIKTDMKLLREKLLNLRNPLNTKNQINLKPPLSFPSKKLHSNEDFFNQKAGEVDPNSQVLNPISSAILPSMYSDNTASHIPSPAPAPPIGTIDNMENSKEFMSSHCNEIHNNEENDYNEDEKQGEEEGQEIEFSENDLTADFDGNPCESVSPDHEMGENEELSHSSELRTRAASTDDEDSVPLALLKNEMYDGSLSPSNNNQVENNIEKSKKVKNNKKVKQSKKGCGPLSLVGASLKKVENDEADGKSKKKAKTKTKKKKDERKPVRPIPAYQLFFRDVQQDIREQNPQLNFGEISKVVSQKWETLEEMQKKKYQDLNEAARVEYTEKFKAYKELIAQEEACEISSPTSTQEFNRADQSSNQTEENDHQEDGTPKRKKKKAGKRKRSKKSPAKGKGFTFDERKVDVNEHIEGKDDETFSVDVKVEISKKTNSRPQKQMKVDDKEDDSSPSSPSLPSSSSSEDDEDSETAISRIRERAAELHKYLKQQRQVVTQKKSKQSGKKLRTLKIETETLSEISEDVPVVVEDSLNVEVQPYVKIEESISDIVVEKETEDNTMEEEIGDNAVEEDLKNNVLDKDLQDTITKEEPTSANETSSKCANDERSSSSGNEDEDQLVILKRKRSMRVKKILEEETMDEEDSSKLKKKRSQALKNRLEETSKSDSEEEQTSFKRKKSTRNKKLEKLSDIGEEISNSKDTHTKIKTSENDDPSKSESEEESNSLKDISCRLKEKEEAESQSFKQETTTCLMNSPTHKTDEIKKDNDSSSELSPEPSPMKNTFRIPKKCNTENGMLALQGPRICIRQACQNPAKTSRERGGQYCGNECLVVYCREVFESWVLDREVEEKNKT